MDNMLAPILAGLDIRILIVIAIGLAVLIVVALIKRAAHIALVLGAVILIVVYGIPMVKSFQENYKFEVSNGVAVIMIDGHEIELDKDYIESIGLSNNGDGTWDANFNSDEGSSYLKIPQFMYDDLKKFANKYNIETDIKE